MNERRSREDCGVFVSLFLKSTKSPGSRRGSTHVCNELGRTALTIQVLVVAFVLTALLLLPGLALVLSGLIFLAALSGLVALLVGLTGLSHILTVSFHITCHE